MTNEQAKQEAIKKAWQKYGVTNYNASGFVDDIGAKYDTWNGDFEFGVGMHRPKILKGISDNNGWTRIEPDGSNLPTDNSEYLVAVLPLSGYRKAFFNNGVWDFPYRDTD